MKTTGAAVFASALLASSTVAQAPICAPSDGDSIRAWMSACDSVVGDSATKCIDNVCHAALHYLKEGETYGCWEFLGLGSHHDFDGYVALDAFCHGESPDPSVTPAPGSPVCAESDGFAILSWMNACDSVAGNSTTKCSEKACHAALHHLEEKRRLNAGSSWASVHTKTSTSTWRSTLSATAKDQTQTPP